MTKRASWIVSGMALTFLSGSPPATAGAGQGASDAAPAYVNAVVVSVDRAAGTVTIRPRGRAPETMKVEGSLAARLGELKAGDEVIVTLQGGRVLEIKNAAGARTRPPTPRRPASPRPGPLTPPGVPRPPTPPAPPTLYPGPPASPGPVISPTPGPTPTPTANPWRTPPPVPTPRPVPTPKRVFPSPEFTVPPSPGPSPTPTPSPQ